MLPSEISSLMSLSAVAFEFDFLACGLLSVPRDPVSRFLGFQELPTDMRPQAGDLLAFKILSLNEETWTPELSAYREAEVVSL